MGAMPWDLDGLPCPVCGGTGLERFPWVLGHGQLWTRHTYCHDCGDFGTEAYDGEDGYHCIIPTARRSLPPEEEPLEEVGGR